VSTDAVTGTLPAATATGNANATVKVTNDANLGNMLVDTNAAPSTSSPGPGDDHRLRPERAERVAALEA